MMASSVRVALAVLALALAGCTHDRDDASISLEALAPAFPSRPLARLPEPFGHVGAVRVVDVPEGLRQEILLDGGPSGGARNRLSILAPSRRGAAFDGPSQKPTEPGIRAEMAAALPHVPLRIVERPSANAYGPYGLAIGRASGDVRCLYAWQWIEPDRIPSDAVAAGPLSIRAVLCRSGTDFDAMAAAFTGLQIARASDPLPAGAAASAPSAPHRRAGRAAVASARRDRRGIARDSVVSYRTDRAAAPFGSPPGFASDLPPEALSGPKLASKQD